MNHPSWDLEAMNAALEEMTAGERVAFAAATFGDDLLFTSSFGADSGALLHLVSVAAPKLPVVFIDTGFLFPETLTYRNALVTRLGLVLRVVAPDLSRADFDARFGTEIQRVDPDTCCGLNKVLPLTPLRDRARAWLSGLRRTQGATRQDVRVLEQDGHLVRVHPLADWTDADVAEYVAAHGIPAHPLTAAGYRSIGCAPCTAPSTASDPRAGRWSWSPKAECGLHTSRRPIPLRRAKGT